MNNNWFKSPSRKSDGKFLTLLTEFGRVSCFEFCLKFRRKTGFTLANTIWIFNYIHENEGEDYRVTLEFVKGFKQCNEEIFDRLILPTAEYELECWGTKGNKVIYRRLTK